MGENLEEKVAELSVCCESCTNRLDKLEARVKKLERWSDDVSVYIDSQDDSLVPCPDCGKFDSVVDAKGRIYKCADCGAVLNTGQ